MSTSVGSVTKFFPSAQNGFTTTLASTISSGAATVPLNSVAGYNNGETAVMVVDPTDASKKQTFTGVVDTAGIQLTAVIWTAGTNQTHTGGSTVVDYATATHISMMTKGLLRDHNQSGYHKTLNDDSGNEWLKQTSTASAVNEVTLANAATGTSPSLTATGNDSNVDIKLIGKGTGKAYTDNITETAFDYVVSGLVWTADAAGSTRVASMTAGIAYVSGVRVTIAAVTSRTFTASKDTYIDISNAGAITYTEATNNAASSALAANNIRIGIIVTGATTIAAAASINQGQEDRVLPIASSIAYTVTDSLGNLICPRDPNRKLLGYRQIVASLTGISFSTSSLDLTGFSVPVIVPANRKIKITFHGSDWEQTGGIGTAYVALQIRESATVFATAGVTAPTANFPNHFTAIAVTSPSAGLHTYKGSVLSNSTGPTGTVGASAIDPAFIMVELD